MTKFYVTDAEGEEVEVEADAYDVDEDGRLVFFEETEDFLDDEWAGVRKDEDEDEDEGETASDLMDRLEETFADDLAMLLALSRVRAVMAQDEATE